MVDVVGEGVAVGNIVESLSLNVCEWANEIVSLPVKVCEWANVIVSLSLNVCVWAPAALASRSDSGVPVVPARVPLVGTPTT